MAVPRRRQVTDLLLSAWFQCSPQDDSPSPLATVGYNHPASLTQGYHKFVVTYVQWGGAANLYVLWSNANFTVRAGKTEENINSLQFSLHSGVTMHGIFVFNFSVGGRALLILADCHSVFVYCVLCMCTSYTAKARGLIKLPSGDSGSSLQGCSRFGSSSRNLGFYTRYLLNRPRLPDETLIPVGRCCFQPISITPSPNPTPSPPSPSLCRQPTSHGTRCPPTRPASLFPSACP